MLYFFGNFPTNGGDPGNPEDRIKLGIFWDLKIWGASGKSISNRGNYLSQIWCAFSKHAPNFRGSGKSP